MVTASLPGESVDGARSASGTKRGRYSTPAVEKAFSVLELISRRDQGLRMIDIVDELDMPKSSAFVLLNALDQLGYVSRDADGRYRLTIRLFELGMRAMRA